MTAGLDLDAVWRAQSGRVLATLVRLLRDFDLAEEALHDAFLAAARRWPAEGVPANPSAWLISAGRFTAIDRLRRRARFDELSRDPALLPDAAASSEAPDDLLGLIFTCCHPALPPEAQVALSLRTLCGLTTEEVARAFLVPTPTIAQRIVRAKARIRDLGLRFEVPEPAEWPARLDAVLRAIYLVFNEGYAARAGDTVVRAGLAEQAIRLGRDLAARVDDPEVLGLLALMLLNHSRRAARQGADGAPILLADQDRGAWDRAMIDEGTALLGRAFASGEVGPYCLQAAIAARHASAASAEATDWAGILSLYDILARAAPSPVVALNRVVALAMARGPAPALRALAPLRADPTLRDYPLLPAVEADLLQRLHRPDEAADAWRRSLALSTLAPERRLIERRIAECEAAAALAQSRA
jgi:RNA polymerase sigma-70 factor (ECF subfamily)